MKTKLLSVLTVIAMTITAAVAATVQYSVTTSVNDEAMGTVVGVKDAYWDGEIAEITAVANDGYWFYRWESADIDPTLAYSPTLKVDRAADVKAIFGKAIYVTTSGVAANDGSSWEKATTIPNAAAIAKEGNVVVISNGTYTAKSSGDRLFLTVTNAIAVRGFSGNRDDVVIDGVGWYVQLVTLSAQGALIGDLTITSGGARGDGYISNLRMSAGSIASNIRSASAGMSNLGVSGNVVSGGMVVDSVFDGATISSGSSIGYLLRAYSGALIARCVMVNGKTRKLSGNCFRAAVHVDGENTVVRDCLIADNGLSENLTFTAASVSGVQVDGGYLINSAVLDNYYVSAASSLACGVSAAKTGKVINCIMIGNSDSAGTLYKDWKGTAANFINCYTTDPDGALSEMGIVLPQSESDFVRDGNEVIIPFGSPLIDGGADVTEIADTLFVPLFDINNEERVSGDAVDIGPTEFKMAPILCSFSASETKGWDKLQPTLAASIGGSDTEGVVFAWDVDGDGVADDEYTGSDKVTITPEITTFGDTVVTLFVRNSNGDTASYSLTFNVEPSVLYVVKDNPDAQSPYATWATAAAEIQDALNAATDGATIILTNGLYNKANTAYSIGKAITLRGATDNYEDTIIQAGYWRIDGAPLLTIGNPGATIANLTVKNGYNTSNTGGVINGGGVVTNCFITGSRMDYSGTTALQNINGKVYDTVIENSQAEKNPHGAYSQSGEFAVTERCIIRNNTCVPDSVQTGQNISHGAYVTGGIIRNCIISGNYFTNSINDTTTRHAIGLLIHNARAENCTIIGNQTGPIIDGVSIAGINGSNSQIVNCLIADNTAKEDACFVVTNWIASTLSFTNCCTTAAVELTGEENIEVTAKTYRPLDDGTYSFGNRSPLLNSGTPMPWAEGTTDVLGKPRVYGGKIDIGSIELQKTAPTLMKLQ